MRFCRTQDRRTKMTKNDVIIKYCAETGNDYLHITSEAASLIERANAVHGKGIRIFFFDDGVRKLMNMELHLFGGAFVRTIHSFFIENNCLYAI